MCTYLHPRFWRSLNVSELDRRVGDRSELLAELEYVR